MNRPHEPFGICFCATLPSSEKCVGRGSRQGQRLCKAAKRALGKSQGRDASSSSVIRKGEGGTEGADQLRWPEPFVSANRRVSAAPGKAQVETLIPMTHKLSIGTSSAAVAICQDIKY
jgi:hypothetical protein